MFPRPLSFTALGLTLLAATSALADIPQPPDYVETCTVERMARPGLDCRSCDAWHGEFDACSKSLGKEGFEQRCRTSGASTWSEIWCRPAGATKPPPPPPNDPAWSAPPVATLAGPATDAPPETTGAATPSTDYAPQKRYALPTEPPPGSRGCGGCAIRGDQRGSMLVGLLLTMTALGGGLRLRRHRRRSP